jgi:exopolysaccharide biosynthesis polyprenyl glycosylphosphotransferase
MRDDYFLVSFKAFQHVHLLTLLVCDLVTGVASFLIAYQLAWVVHQSTSPYSTWMPFLPYFKLAVIWTFLNVLIFAMGGLYSRGPWGEFGGELGQILTSVSISMILAMALTFLFRNFDFSRLVFMSAWISSILLFWVERGLLRLIRRGIYVSGAGHRRLMIWGCDEVARKLLTLYGTDLSKGKSTVALIDGWSKTEYAGTLPLLTPDEGRQWIEEGRADEVIVTRHDLPREDLYKLAQACRTNEIALKLVPDLMEVVAGHLSVEGVEGFPMVEMGNNLGRYYPQLVKRVFDIAIGGIITIILLPVLAIIAILIKGGSPGPVLFEHWRLGRGKKKFPQFKFRTMVRNADEILANNPELMEQFKEGFKLKDDPRITPIGKFLRRYSLDELPQLFNVLRGEMSLVGPRPIVEAEVEKYGVFADALFSVTPGMTGLWQVSGRSDVGYDERVKLDLLYIERWTLWEDMRILLLTPGAVVGGRGSY